MEINDLQIEKYIKVANLSQISQPEILSSLCALDKKDYARDIQYFDVVNENSHRYQFYVSRVPPRMDVLNDIVFVKEAPKILFLKGDAESLALEEKVADKLSDYLVYFDQKQSPYLHESEARSIVMEITDSAENYLKHKILYDCLSTQNVVRLGEKWMLSAVGLIFGVNKNLPDYTSDAPTEQQKKLTYSLGCLLFKLCFGFAPFSSSSHHIKQFAFKNYLTYLEKSESKGNLLKIYYYGLRILELSPSCLSLLEDSLSCKLSLREWKEHQYFVRQFRHESPLNEKNKELKMVSSVEASSYSLMMAAIEYKKKYHLEKLNPKPIPSASEPTNSEIVEQYSKNYLLKHLRFVPGFEKKQLGGNNHEKVQSVLPALIQDYFYEDYFDPEEDYPCRDLLKLIQRQKQDYPDQFNDKKEAQLKMYAYPYAITFQLCKVENEQPPQIRKKIKKSIELLLQVSALLYPGNIKPLHNTKPECKEFSEMKGVYREHINELYRYFLNEAMRKYNSKEGSSIMERMKKKEKGLAYYRLCLKLLEASLIVRKEGRDLDLGRIETSQRKEIEQDLEQLLKTYFPNKAQIH